MGSMLVASHGQALPCCTMFPPLNSQWFHVSRKKFMLICKVISSPIRSHQQESLSMWNVMMFERCLSRVR